MSSSDQPNALSLALASIQASACSEAAADAAAVAAAAAAAAAAASLPSPPSSPPRSKIPNVARKRDTDALKNDVEQGGSDPGENAKENSVATTAKVSTGTTETCEVAKGSLECEAEAAETEVYAKGNDFPAYLHRFLRNVGISNPKMFTFTNDGAAFSVQISNPGLGEVLMDNFGHDSVALFAQNLLSRGWSRFVAFGRLYFTHPCFHRDLSRCDFSKIPLEIENSSLSGNRTPGNTLNSVQIGVVSSAESSSRIQAAEPEAPPDSPPAKFRVFQPVLARDTDGVMYEAVVRRRLYGQSQHKQVQLGLVASEQEANELLAQEEEPTWHYFVHYNKWNVNWDRWVPEANVYEPSDHIRAYADRLLSEHRALRAELTKKVKGKKAFQTVEGSEFLQRWRLVRAKVDDEMRPDGESTCPSNADPSPISDKKTIAPKTTSKRPESWSKTAIVTETKLRERRLASKMKHSNTLSLPFALKKCLVESWEVITQCHMVLSLPAPITVRQALEKYLESKGIAPSPTTANDPGPSSEPAAPNSPVTNLTADSDADGRDQEWREMADGIALLFDEALPNRLLYREEFPQYNAVLDHPEYSLRRYSDVYGCEHLLRLFVRLPEVVADEMSEAEARPILAKVNDLIRFLHKNQGTMLAQPYRKLNDVEMKERNKLIKKEEAKRKRRLEQVYGEDDDSASKKPTTETGVGTDSGP